MAEKRHILISGERGVGKSTLIERLLSASTLPRYGFITKMRPAGPDGFHPVYIHPAGQPPHERVYTDANCIGACDSRTDYDYLQDVEFRVFGLKDGSTYTLSIPGEEEGVSVGSPCSPP